MSNIFDIDDDDIIGNEVCISAGTDDNNDGGKDAIIRIGPFKSQNVAEMVAEKLVQFYVEDIERTTGRKPDKTERFDDNGNVGEVH